MALANISLSNISPFIPQTSPPPLSSSSKAIFDLLSQPEISQKDKNWLNKKVTKISASQKEDFLNQLLKHPFQKLATFFNLLNQNTHKKLLMSVDSYFFKDLTEKVIREEVNIENKQEILNKCFRAVKGKLDILAKDLYTNVERNDYLPLITLLDRDVSNAFRKRIQEKDYQQLFEDLASKVPPKNATKPLNFDVLLQFKLNFQSDSWQQHLLLDSTSPLTSHAKHCIIWCANPELRKKILSSGENTWQDFVELLEGSLDLESEFEKKLKLFQDFINVLNDDNDFDFFLNELIESHPNLLPYLPCVLSNMDFDYVFQQDEENADRNVTDTVTKILNTCLIDHETPLYQIAAKLSNTKLGEQDRLFNLLKKVRFTFKQTEADDITYTLEEIKQEIENFLNEREQLPDNEKESFNLAICHGDNLIQIPPYLLALSLYLTPNHEFIKNSMSSWNTSQCQAIGSMASQELLEYCIESCPNQLPDMMNTISKTIFIKIIKSQQEGMKKAIKEAESQCSLLNCDLTKYLLQNNSESLTKEIYEELLKRIQILTALQKFDCPLNRLLNNKIENNFFTLNADEETVFEDYQTTIEALKNKQEEIRAENFYCRLENLEKLLPQDTSKEVDTEDALSLFSEEFITLLTTEMTHLIGLQELSYDTYKDLAACGIQKQKDLEVLDYSIQKQTILQNIRNKILSECWIADPKSILPIYSWNKLFYEQVNFEEAANHYIKDFKLLDLPIEKLKQLAITLITDCTKLDRLNEEESQIFEKRLRNFEQSDHTQAENLLKMKSFCSDMILTSLSYYKKHEITIQIQRYLFQNENLENLKKIWNQLKQKNIFSLSDFATTLKSNEVNIFKLKSLFS